MTDEYIRKADAVDAVEFGITLASAINIETGERTELFQRENDELREAVKRIKDIESADVVQVIRCRKCKYFWTYRCMDSMPIETCELAQTFYNPDLDFCSLAKRREE